MRDPLRQVCGGKIALLDDASGQAACQEVKLFLLHHLLLLLPAFRGRCKGRGRAAEPACQLGFISTPLPTYPPTPPPPGGRAHRHQHSGPLPQPGVAP